MVFEGDPNASDGGLAGFYTGYVPGQIPVAFPPGTGKLLKKGQLFTFQMHYTAAGPNQTEQTELGLYVSPVPPNDDAGHRKQGPSPCLGREKLVLR